MRLLPVTNISEIFSSSQAQYIFLHKLALVGHVTAGSTIKVKDIDLRLASLALGKGGNRSSRSYKQEFEVSLSVLYSFSKYLDVLHFFSYLSFFLSPWFISADPFLSLSILLSINLNYAPKRSARSLTV